jgi:alanyl-tRNA synthetase
MKSAEIRERFLKYFESRGHTVVPSSGLVPEADPTLLFTNAGMVQFKGVFLTEETREYKRAVTCQRCMRAGGKHNDLENVGKTARHHTFFEMLGNFSFGDYFKEGAIEYAWEFLTKELKLPADKIWITVYEEDDEAAGIWQKKTGVPAERIVRMGAEDNFWSMGDVGPCGPCSEILIDQGEELSCGKPTCKVGCDCDRFLEIWNLVFMQYNRDAEGRLTPLPSPCIDTGLGLERLTAVMQGKRSNYDSDLFVPIIRTIEDITDVRYGVEEESDVSIKAIADHARATAFLMTEGVLPGNEGRGYVLRRIVRRAARHGRFLGLTGPFLYRVTDAVIEQMGKIYPELLGARDLVVRATRGEEERFFETLERGLALLDEELKALKKSGGKIIPGDVAFKLYDTYGFPVDLTADIVSKEGIGVDEAGFNSSMEEQKTRARKAGIGLESHVEGRQALYQGLSGEGVKTGFVGYHMEAASSKVVALIKGNSRVESSTKGDEVELLSVETPFYGESGGQVGDTGTIAAKGLSIRVTDTIKAGELIVHRCVVEEGTVSVGDTVELLPDMEKRRSTARNHTATHILQAALRKTLGEHVRQAGSLVGPDRLRFDFNHFESLKDAEIREIEETVNKTVIENTEVITDVLQYDEAIKTGALAFFGEKYAGVVRMVQVPGVSAELCGGTHVKRTGDIGFVRISGESSVASGVRRIEAVTGERAIAEVEASEKVLKETTRLLRVPKADVPGKIKKLLLQTKELEKEIERLKGRKKAGAAEDLADKAREIKGVKVLSARVEAGDPKELRDMADSLRTKLGSGIVILGSPAEGKVVFLAAVTRDLTKKFKAGEIIKRVAAVAGGRGGGKPDMAQAGGGDPSKLDEAIEAAYKTVEEMADS